MLEQLKQKITFKEFTQKDLNADKNLKIGVFTGLEFKDSILVVTEGLSAVSMEVPDGLEEKANVELCILLPKEFNTADLALEDIDVRLLIEKISNLVLNKKSWIGAGHTFPNIKKESAISLYTEMQNFMLIEPILLEEDLSGIKIEDKEVTYLAIIPIFKRELNYLQKNGAFTLLKKMKKYPVTEFFDVKRPSSIKRKLIGK